MVAAFYKFHPDAVNASDSWDILNISTWRSNGTFVLLLAWHCRLTYSYMRREKWQLGAREDWRFSDMRTKYGAAWNFISIFYAYLSQMPLMFGLTLPYYIINLHSHHLDGSFNEYDVWIIAYAAIGLLIAHQAGKLLVGGI